MRQRSTGATRLWLGIAVAACLGARTPASGQDYELSVIARGLERPTGIAVHRKGNVYFTQLPTPGVNGDNGGRNRVSVYDGNNIFDLSSGEPEPTDVAVDDDGTAYWTCTWPASSFTSRAAVNERCFCTT